jgi:beta-lysine 5,6-aminomutase beta subunit
MADGKLIRPYGDTLDDGMMQLSFTLPVPSGAKAKEAALTLLRHQGFKEPKIVHMQDLTTGFTQFVAYASASVSVDWDSVIAADASYTAMDMDEVNERIKASFGRKLVIVGACTGTDAHTVGIDAIMNMKGFHGHYGLERYAMLKAINMGAQVPNDVLVAKAVAENADAILVSQVVTQKNGHITNLTQLVDLLEAENLRDRFIVVVGGPRITHELATELGFEAGFGPGCYAEDVASYVVEEMERRQGLTPPASHPN